MATWYPDEGLARLTSEWKREHPGAVVYYIGDSNHSTNPDVTQHAPDRGGSLPGDDKGEVDGADYMPGNGVTAKDMDDLFNGLVQSRDPRILYVIHKDTIVSSVVQPWVRRKYNGAYHGHVHVSVNDKFDKNTADWNWEAEVARSLTYEEGNLKMPILKTGDDDDILPGFNLIGRIQTLANMLDGTTADVDVDGVLGPRTMNKIKVALKLSSVPAQVNLPIYRALMGLGG